MNFSHFWSLWFTNALFYGRDVSTSGHIPPVISYKASSRLPDTWILLCWRSWILVRGKHRSSTLSTCQIIADGFYRFSETQGETSKNWTSPVPRLSFPVFLCVLIGWRFDSVVVRPVICFLGGRGGGGCWYTLSKWPQRKSVCRYLRMCWRRTSWLRLRCLVASKLTIS